MKDFNRVLWPILVVIGVLSQASVYLISVFDPEYTTSAVTDSFLLLIPIGVIGSIVSITYRNGFRKTLPLLIVWAIALFSVVQLYTGDDFESFGWLLPLGISTIIGTVMLVVYMVRSPR